MIAQITPSEFQAWVAAQPQAVTLLDVRESWELQTASVVANGFELKHLPMNDTPARLTELDQSSPIACLCHHGARSMQVASFLVQQGFSHVANVAGGIHAWSSQVDATVPMY